MRPRKQKADRKTERLLVLVTVEQKKALTNTADAAGLPLSTWLLSLGLREAKRAS
jgi:uncharacterized protein (DUF1778 family)